MSQYGGPVNPDRRELPPGWIEQYDENYNKWFYVYTRDSPPRSSWVHPLGPPGSHYAPPPGPPPPGENRGFNASPYGGGPGYGSPQSQRWGNDYGGPPQGGYNSPPGGYGGTPPAGYRPQGYGPPAEQRGFFGGGPPVQEIIQAPPQKKHGGMGIGTAVLAGGAGLLAGGLLTEAFEHHENYEREVGFEQGRELGFDQGENVGFNQGENVGFDQGENVGFNQGEDIGFDRGENVGFDQGFQDGEFADNW
ncbi:hypothetical protein B0H21DRAFT_819568 [Amylocystis lapponica]|nr:hypothetical protein B0H21DRAFT_819568 [Amylocystis lapponica]